MSEQVDGISAEGQKLLMEAAAVVFGATVAGLETEDPAKEAEIVRELWPQALDMSGYEIAKQCILMLAGSQSIPNDVLADIAMYAMGQVRPTS